MHIKKLISIILCVILIIVSSGPLESKAVDSTKSYYTYSPLLTGDTMAIDELQPYELECFAIFLSNFCVPFVDSYVSAFSSTSAVGSCGAGLAALQFATGGDVYADSIVRRMTNLVLDDMARTYKPLIVEDYAIGGIEGELKDKNSLLSNVSTEFNKTVRDAYLADLLPLLHFVVESDTTSNRTFDYDGSNPTVIWNHAWLGGVTSTDVEVDAVSSASTKNTKHCADLTITHGVLGKFYITDDENHQQKKYSNPVFDMTNGWDVQIPSNCLLYAMYKDGGAYLNVISELLDNAATLPLVMDSIGNICTLKDGLAIVIIPAYLNQHLIGEGYGTINLLGSVFIDSLCSSTDKLTIAAGIAAPRARHNNATENQQPLLNAGLGQLVYNGTSVAPGTSFIYNTYTDNLSKGALYKQYDKLDSYAFSSYLNTGLNIEDSLRWSTGIHFDPGIGSDKLAIDTWANVTLSDSDNADRSSEQSININHDSFNHTTVWNAVRNESKAVLDIETTELYTAASAFQIAAQLYATNAKTGLKDIKCYYKTLKDNSRTDLIYGINPVTAEADKDKLVYVPVGGDVSGAIDTAFTYHDAHKWQNTYKQFAMLTIDMKHGKSVIELPETDKLNLINVISKLCTDDGIKTWIMPEMFESADSSAKKLYTYIHGTEISSTDFNKFTSTDYTSSDWPTSKVINMQWAKIAPATAYLKTAASYLGLHEDCTFSLFASDMYYSYLDIYGLIGGTEPIFIKDIFTALGSVCTIKTPEELGKSIMTQGLTAEQKEQMTKENVYLMLSQDEDGREYRSRMVDGIFNEWLVESYDKMCYGDTSSDYFKTLNSTSNSFINLRTYSENFLTKAVVVRWTTILPILMLILSLIIVIIGTINNKKLPWIFCNLLICTCMLITLPALSETIPYVVEKVSDKAFSNAIDTMAISEAVEDDVIRADIKKQFEGYGEKISTAIDSLSALGTSGSLMLKQDITRKVIPKSTGSTFQELKGLASAQWLLPNLLSMTGADTVAEYNDYVYRALGEKRMELRKMSTVQADKDSAYKILQKISNSSITDLDEFKKSLNHGTNLYQSMSRPNESVEVDSSDFIPADEHLYGLILSKLNGTPVEYVNVEDFDSEIVQTLIGEISTIDEDSSVNSISYLQGTETLLPYFYLVAKDGLKNCSQKTLFEQLNMQDYYNAISHTRDYSGVVKHTNLLTVVDSNTIDVLDLEYLFTYYIPYLLYMQETATESLTTEDGSIPHIGSSYPIYSKEPMDFLFKCNWADKIVNAYNYNKEHLNPNSDYYKNRTIYPYMIFSEAQLANAVSYAQSNNTSFTYEDLTDIELACIEVNKQVDKAWTLLVNYITTDGVTMDILTEQMAISATLIFNTVISQDRIVSSNHALYPSAISLRTINFDTMMKMVLMSNFGLGDFNQQSMRIVLAESGILSGIVLLCTAWITTVLVPFMMDLVMAIIFYSAILSCAYNACIDGKEKLKTFGGASISVYILALETILYVYSYAWIIGDTNKVLSAKQFEAGTTIATGKLLVLLLVTIIYLGLLVFHGITSVKNFKDMSFQMWASYSQKSFNAATRAVAHVRNKIRDVKNGIKLASGDAGAVMDMLNDKPIPVSIKNKDGKVKIESSSKEPVFVKATNNSADEATIIWQSEDGSDNSGYILKTNKSSMHAAATANKNKTERRVKPAKTSQQSDSNSQQDNDKPKSKK